MAEKKTEKEKEHEARYYKQLKDKKVHCQLCPHFCIIDNNAFGKCRVRKNVDGKLYSLVYGKPCSVSIDPIEKKPLFHFMPGQKALSIATVGCNFSCLHCQNWSISQAKVEDVPNMDLPPDEVVAGATKENIKIISYTYTEPTIFFEYMLDIAKIARKENIKNTIVSNGFINPEPLSELSKFLDGANIDVKGNEKFYKELCGSKLEPVLETIKTLHKAGVWIEVTNLIIPGYNDNEKEIMKIVNFIKNLNKNIPLHFSAFYPAYKMQDTPSTSTEIIKKARNLAMKHLNYVYTGNIFDDEGNSTLCPKCKKQIIKRNAFFIVTENNLEQGKCKFCGEKIAGIWK
jgi:pyruvate formate lyase activating enzyme